MSLWFATASDDAFFRDESIPCSIWGMLLERRFSLFPLTFAPMVSILPGRGAGPQPGTGAGEHPGHPRHHSFHAVGDDVIAHLDWGNATDPCSPEQSPHVSLGILPAKQARHDRQTPVVP